MGEVEDADFEPWYRALHPRLLATLILMTGDGEMARDATDEAFTRALERWARVRRMESPDAWTFTVARNVVRRRHRRMRQERALLHRLDGDRRATVPAP